MNHRPFEDWLLDDQPLNEQEQRELQAHLHACTSCTAIAEANLALRSTRWVSPTAGFARRFSGRLARWKTRQRRYQVLGTLVLVLGGLAAMYLFAGPLVRQALQSPADWITAVAVYLVFAAESAQILAQVARILLRDIPGFLSPTSWMVIVLASTCMVIVWGISVRRLAAAPEGAGK
jgi:hypothetical protein